MTDKTAGLTAGFMQRVAFVILAIGAALLAFHLMSLWIIIFGHRTRSSLISRWSTRSRPGP